MLVIGLGGPIGVMDALVGVNSIWLGPDVLGPSGVRSRCPGLLMEWG